MEACHDGKRALYFFKVMIEAWYLQFMYFPLKFARSISHLADKGTYLEDSSGLRWRVTVCKQNGSLAIKQGWPEFSSEHGLKLGNFLVFRYVPSSQHFIVQIFGTSGCEMINFCSDTGKGKKIGRTNPEATTPLLQITSGASEFEKVTYTSMIDRDAQNDQDDDRLCFHLSSFEMPTRKDLAQGTSSRDNRKGKKRAMIYPEAIRTSLLGPKDKKSKEASQFESGEEYVNSNEKDIKSVPDDSGDAPSLNADSYSCLVEVNGRDFLELPESWQKHLLKRSKKGRRIIFLRGLDKRIWPTFYHGREGFNVLTSGWKQITAAYGLNPGDECLFQLVNQRGRIFDVHKI